MENNQHNSRSSHILNASSNLLGICFVVLTSLKLLDISRKTVIDEITLAATVLFMLSCILSFVSLRGNPYRSTVLEKIADFTFLAGIGLLFITTILFSFNLIR